MTFHSSAQLSLTKQLTYQRGSKWWSCWLVLENRDFCSLELNIQILTITYIVKVQVFNMNQTVKNQRKTIRYELLFIIYQFISCQNIQKKISKVSPHLSSIFYASFRKKQAAELKFNFRGAWEWYIVVDINRNIAAGALQLQFVDMSPEQIAERMKTELEQGSALTQGTIGQLKKYFEQVKNAQNVGSTRPQEMLGFKERVIGYLLSSLIKNQHTAKEKIMILEVLERDLISTKHNSNLFNKLYNYLLEEDENVAIQASKAIDQLIKQINEGTQATPTAVTLDTKQHYLKLFQFLKDRTQFLVKLSEHAKDPEYKVYRRQNYEERDRDKDKQRDKKEIILKNNKSLKFINQVPHLFIHLMAYVDTSNRNQEDDNKIKDLIRKSIDNIIQSLRKTPYEQFYNEFNYDFNNELFAVMTKLLQFLFINLRSEKDQNANNNKSNINLKKHIADQIEHIKVHEVIKNFIYLLKNCSEDFQLNRYQIVNRLKLLLNNLDKTKLNKTDAVQIMNEILCEETIFGRKKVLGDYSKNAICSYWIEMIKSNVLLYNIFPHSILSVKSIPQGIQDETPEVANCFANIQRLIEEVLKTMFDNTFYPSVQEKCIQLVTFLIDQLFPEGVDYPDNVALFQTNILARKIQEHKLKILLRILDCASLKLMNIRHIFEEIDEYITRKLGHKVTKKELPEPLKLDHMQLSSLGVSLAQSNQWQKQAVDFIQNQREDIDNSLLTVSVVQNKFITIYEEEDQLCFNSHPVKSNNYTLYMKEVKTKLLEKCITLAHKITKTFLSQNIDMYNNVDISSLKAIYFVLSNKKALTHDQCKVLSTILKNGLKIFEILHNYDLHSDDQTNKKGHLKNFMLIFAQIYDPVNFRDIFEPNMNEFFKNLINYAKNCAQYCLQFVLIEPYCSNQQSQPFNKNIVELLTYNLIIRLENTSDQLDPFHEFYHYKQEYFLLLQKLIRFPFRCLSRYSDQSFIRNYFRQIILFLTKKAHTSRFCLDYLHLMRTLFKNILFNSNREAASPLFSEFYAICYRNAQNMNTQSGAHSVFINVNVLDNFLKFYETGIPELADIVTQLVIMLPLKSKHIIQFAKQGYIVKPLLHCLCLMSDYNYLLRTLKTFEIIISHSTADEISQFLNGVKDKLINRLFEMIVAEHKPNDLKPEKINNDLSSLSLKLLAKLGALSRNRDITIDCKSKKSLTDTLDFKLLFEGRKQDKITVSLSESIDYAIQIFHKLLDSFYQSIIFISMQMIQKSFEVLVDVLPLALSKMHPLAQKILFVFCAILALSSKYLTISPSLLTKIREDIKNEIKRHTEVVKNQIRRTGLTQYTKFYLKALVENLSERVLITREENFIKQISQEPKKFLWGLLSSIIDQIKETNAYEETVEYIMRLLISAAVSLKNPHQIRLNPYQYDYNHILPYKNAALGVLNELIDKAPVSIIDDLYPDILDTVFVAVASIPDILSLKIMKHPRAIARKIFKHMLRDEQIFMEKFKTQKGKRVFSCILESLIGYSSQGHQIAMQFVQMIMKETNIGFHQLLYGGSKWDQVADKGKDGIARSQAKHSLNDFTMWRQMRYEMQPIVPLVKNLLRIAHNINEESLKSNPSLLKMLHNCFATLELLISLKHEDKIYQAFMMLQISEQGDQSTITFNETFKKIITVAQQVISINDKIYENYTKIIIEQPPQNSQIVPGAPRQPPPNPGRNAGQARDPSQAGGQVPPPPQPANNQSFSINTNTFIDDQQYGLNIEDLDIEIKNWGKLIGAILRFLKTILINDNIYNASKSMLRRKNDRTKLVETRLDIIFVMFDLIGRVDKTVRETAYQCLRQLLAKQEHPKDLIQNDEKLKHILRPVLISLQLQFKKFTPSFLHMFKKILKLLTQCFNITLIQKLVDKLRQMEKTKEQEAANQSKSLPTQQNPKHLNYSEITLETKCIANFLALFQHLAYAYHNHRSSNYTVNSIILIFKYVGNICNYFTPKLGRHAIKMNIKTTLAKVLNTMCEKLSGQSIFVEGQERQLDLENFLQIISLDDSFPLREKLTRQTTYIDKALVELAKNKTKKQYLVFLEIIYVLAKKNNRWLKGFSTFGDKIMKELNEAVNNRYTAQLSDKKEFEMNEKNEVILLAKVLLEYIKQNIDDLKALFSVVGVFKLRGTLDLHFIRRFLKYDLYERASAQTKRQILLEFFNMLRGPQSGDCEKIIAISQQIIYHFILQEVNMPEEERQLLKKDDQLMKSLAQTIKVCLNPRLLHNKGFSGVSFRQSANNYRIAIEMLQISNLALSAIRNVLNETDRNAMILTIWGLLRIEDKIIKNYAFVWASNYIRTFEGFDANKALGLYLTLIRSLESLSQGDYEIGALIKKALNILIPYWDTRQRTQTSWIDWSLKAVHEQSNEPSKLVRFWQIVVKNHNIFHKFKQNKFETQMVNSMQWLMVANNPTSTNPLVKKIASDMSFIYIEWKFKEAKAKLLQTPADKKISVLEDSLNDRAAEICLNFFIKVALNNSSDKDDKEIMKRSLFLLKKTLILWPHTKKKFEAIRTIVNKLKSSSSNMSMPNNQMPLRFHYTLLNIIHILLLYERDDRVLPQLTSIFKLLQLGGHITPQRFPAASSPHASQVGNTIFTMNNIYLLNLLCIIIRRLVSIALKYQKQDQSTKLIGQLHNYIRDGFEFHIWQSHKKPQGGNQPLRTGQPMKKIDIQVAICFLKILYDLDPKTIDTHLNYIKQVTSSLKKMFEKGFETSSKNSSQNRVYELPPLSEGTFEQMLAKDMEIRVQLIKPEALATAEQNYEKDNIKSYGTRRPLFVILLRILASKFNNFSHVEDQANILDIFLSIYEKIPDPELKIEVINILKCMFVGEKAFKSFVIPERYQQIGVINYPVRKIFHLLFEDCSKFNQHFQKRKSKPSDQNYNINERIYEEITTKIYYNFLCHFVINMPKCDFLNHILQKVKIFLLFAVKVADADVLEQIFKILDEHYAKSSLDIYVNLFEDYKELNCNEENLQGDEITMFFTYYLYRRAAQQNKPLVTVFGQTKDSKMHDYFLYFLRADVSSSYYLAGVSNTLNSAIRLLPPSKHLHKVMKDYLLYGSYYQGWGNILLNIALERKFLSPEEIYTVVQRINQWGLFLKQMQHVEPDKAVVLLDYAYRAYGDVDMVYGYRMLSTSSSNMREALLNIQQRRYVDSLACLDKEKKLISTLARRPTDEEVFQLPEIGKIVDESLMIDISRQCYKNLNEWGEVIEKGKTDVLGNTEFLFHAEGNKDKINSILGSLDKIGVKQFPYYYGRSVINFLQSNSSQNKQLNLALLYALVQWLVFPKYSRHNQNKMLVKIECLLQLEEGQKIKEQSLGASPEQPSVVEALTKVVQSVYTQINSWRQRMPQKHEDLSTWHAILGQRITIYEFMKSKMMRLLDSVVNNQSNYGPGINTGTGTEKLLVPYTDIEWNKLRLIKQQRYFGVFPSSFSVQSMQNLYMDETLLAHKEKFYYHFLQEKDHQKAVDSLQGFIKDHQQGQKDQQLFKIQKLEITRLKGKVLAADGKYDQADALFIETIKGVEQHLLPLWRDWLVLSLKAYRQTDKIQWAQSVLMILPYALRYKTQKTKLLLAPVMQLLYNLHSNAKIVDTLSNVIQFIPVKLFLLWLPQILRLAELEVRQRPKEQQSRQSKQARDKKEHMYKILEKTSVYYPQIMYFTLKQFYKDVQIKAVKEVFLNIKKIYYNLITKLQNFAQLVIEITTKCQTIPVHILGALSRTVCQVQIPLFENWRGQMEPSSIPTLTEFSQQIQIEKVNGKSEKVLIATGSDGKEYRLRVELVKRDKQNYAEEYQGLLMTQVLEVANYQLGYHRQTLSRKLKLLAQPKIFFYNLVDEVRLARSNVYCLTPLDILNNYLEKNTSYKPDYPFSDKNLMALPKKAINKHMRQIIPKNVLRQYLEDKTNTYDDFLMLRKTLAYQYGALSCVQFTLSIPLELENLFINIRTGDISLWNLKFKNKPGELEPFAVRLSTGIQELFGDNYVNGACLPAFISTLDALRNPKMNFKAYLQLLYQDLNRIRSDTYTYQDIFDRLEKIHDNYDKAVRLWQVAGKFGRSNDVPPSLKYWL